MYAPLEFPIFGQNTPHMKLLIHLSSGHNKNYNYVLSQWFILYCVYGLFTSCLTSQCFGTQAEKRRTSNLGAYASFSNLREIRASESYLSRGVTKNTMQVQCINTVKEQACQCLLWLVLLF